MPSFKVFTSFYLRRRFFIALGGVALLFVLGHFVPVLTAVARAGLIATVVLAMLDGLLLYRMPQGVRARRQTPERFSNGDDNALHIYLTNEYRFLLHATIIDELPFQFQIRDATYRLSVPPGGERILRYSVRPVQRGAYVFGAVNVYAASPLGLVSRRYRFDEGREVPVYPSFLQMRKYELLAVSNRLEEIGVKKVRRVGHTMEFDHVRDYVLGDDPRTINWKATARRGTLMINQYRDERAQPVYSVLDMGRVMKMPFDGMTLLDYSINASLVLSNIALLKQDRAGLVTFSHDVGTLLPAERKSGQIYTIQEVLYNLQTDFLESDYARLVAHLRRHLRQRSLVLLFTNFETRTSMQRQLPFLRALARQHVVVAVFFENTSLRTLLDTAPRDTEGIYIKTIAEKFAFEKREVVKDLSRHGIQSILTAPQDLSVNTINKYLELKARGMV
ncbi:MAG: DUF58 domain-containing protein [Rhodothermales bacterium]